MVKCYISLERKSNSDFNDVIFRNYYHLEPETWHMSRNFFRNYDILYIVEKVMKNAFQ